MNRICTLCKNSYPETEAHFGFRKNRNSFQSYCRKCSSDYRKEHYKNNKKKYLRKAVVYRNKVREWFLEYKKALSCCKCNDKRYWVLDFHHERDKEGVISELAFSGSKKRLQNEIAKCIVLCANCHRDHHYKENLNKL